VQTRNLIPLDVLVSALLVSGFTGRPPDVIEHSTAPNLVKDRSSIQITRIHQARSHSFRSTIPIKVDPNRAQRKDATWKHPRRAPAQELYESDEV
jgi:hypothetical protein